MKKPAVERRIIAYLIDVILLRLPLILFILLVIFTDFKLYRLEIVFTFAILFNSWLYVVYFLSKDYLFSGRSVGKLLLGIQVFNEKGKPCTFIESAARNAVLIIPFFPIIEGIALIADEKGKRIGDYIAQTTVGLKKKKAKNTTFSVIFLAVMFFILIFMYLSIFSYGMYAFTSNVNSHIYLEPKDDLTAAELEKTAELISQRLSVYGFIAEVEVVEDLIVVQCTEDLVKEIDTIKDLFNKGNFQAVIGDETVFRGGLDVVYVCRTAECSGMDPFKPPKQDDGRYTGGFRFAVTLSPEAAERFAEITKDLDVVTVDDNQYLSEDLVMYLDGEKVDSLKISPDLKGRATADIQISGEGSGFDEDGARTAALSNMKRMQTILIAGNIPADLEVVKMETIKN
jgi:uncharacterized RDD family membrane protein YckC